MPRNSVFMIWILLMCVEDSLTDLKEFCHYGTPDCCVRFWYDKGFEECRINCDYSDVLSIRRKLKKSQVSEKRCKSALRYTKDRLRNLTRVSDYQSKIKEVIRKQKEICRNDLKIVKSNLRRDFANNITTSLTKVKMCMMSESICQQSLRSAEDRLEDLSRQCDSNSTVTEAIREEKESCNRQLQVAKDNLNKAVTQNVRTTITDLATETRVCIRLTEAECRGQSSTCVWDSSLTVLETPQKGACLSARFE